MGILADFFVAQPSDAALYASPKSQYEAALLSRLNPAQYKGFTSLDLTALWAILVREPWDVDRHVLLDQSPPGETDSWLFRFPEVLVQALASASASELNRATLEWAATEELECEASDLAPVLADLHRLAQSAVSRKEGLYLWGST